MPAGPSTLDEIANAAFWFGLMIELGAREEDITRRIDFDQARRELLHRRARGPRRALHVARRRGHLARATLVLERLLPLARGRACAARASTTPTSRSTSASSRSASAPARTGARWLLSSWNSLRDRATPGERANALVAATVQRQLTGRPVSEWERARLDEARHARGNYLRVEQLHDDRPVHGARRRPDRDGREPHDLGAHPPRPRRGPGPPPRRRSSRIARVLRFVLSGGSHATHAGLRDHEARRRHGRRPRRRRSRRCA